MKQRRLSAKITAVITLYAMTAIAIAGLLVYSGTTKLLTTNISDHQMEMGRETFNAVDNFLYRLSNTTRAMASSEDIINFLLSDKKNISQVTAKLEEMENIYAGKSEVAILDSDGIILASSETGMRGTKRGVENKKFIETLSIAKEGEVGYSDVIADNYGKKELVLVFMAPIYASSSKEQLLGILERRTDFSGIDELITAREDYQSNYLINSDGIILSASNLTKNKIFENIKDLPLWQEINRCSRAGTKILPSLSSGAPSITSYIVHEEYRGLQGCNWALVSERDHLTTMTPVKNSVIQMCLALGLVIMIMAILALIYMQKIIVSPINALALAMSNIKADNPTLKMEEPDNEIGWLISTFKNLLSQIQELSASTQAKIAEKTTALDLKIREVTQQNTKLNDIKIAVINVLEDTQELEVSAKREGDRAQGIISSMGEGLVVVDASYNVIMANKIATDLFEAKQKDVVGNDLRKVISIYQKDRELAPEERPIAQVLKNGKPFTAHIEDNFYCQTLTGKKFPLVFAITPIIGREIEAAVIVFKDATEEKSLDSAKTNFISVASHQLRTPLTSIRWFTEMILDGDAGEITDQQKHFIDRVYESTLRMSDLVNLLLQIARVEAGRIIIEPEPISLKDLTAQVVDSLKPILKAKSQEVIITSEPEALPQIPMDKSVVWQVIQNLLTNAGRYGFARAPIRISIIKKGEELEYSVSNEGIGVPRSYFNRIFEKFFRAENAVKAVPEGSGLGLALVKSLVAGWGGRVWFESEEGKTTTFHVTVPLRGMEPKAGEVKLTI